MRTNLVAKTVEDLLDVVEQQKTSVYQYRYGDPAMDSFQRLDTRFLLLDDDDPAGQLFNDADPKVIWPISTGAVIRRYDGRWVFGTAKSVTPKDVRGKANRISPTMLQVSFIEQKDNRVFAAHEYYSYLGGKWVDGIRDQYSATVDKTFQSKAAVFCGLALAQRYEWSVSIGHKQGPSFRFTTDTQGIASILRQRSKHEGSNRRKALKSWIQDHWRSNVRDRSTEIYVRKHMRGDEVFYWNDYRCIFSPAPFDEELNEKLREERKHMHEQAKRPRFGDRP